MDEYIQNSLKESKQKVLINNIYTFIKDPLPAGFDLDLVLATVKETVPEHLVYGLESIYIGQFDELKEKDMSAVYKDGAIYATNEQFNEGDLIDDIVHELAHLIEERMGEYIYDDRSVVDEFLGKRRRFHEIMKSEGYAVPIEHTYDLEYNEDFDKFLYKTVGYDKLTFLTIGLFVSPYSITSLREYFAKAFQHYFLRDMGSVKRTSPATFQKIEFLVFQEYEQG
ncbi:hypothetical protein CMI37_27630 [Candidatus Pacearchaeota archaeon]|nr:hypothetical protein [Candidatus Pacearchaeota archaeon]|tara:strand:+ start:231 stop:905 length:675 start_codon:yes stop_codon:yes gene_type:complete